jgi:hypothetical protein
MEGESHRDSIYSKCCLRKNENWNSIDIGLV